MKSESSFKILNSLNINCPYNGNCKCNCISIRELLKLISQILIPLMIGTFTVVIALQQHNLNKQNRKNDLEIAEQLRKQQYQIDEQRRTQELILDEARRIQDLTIADNKQRDSVFNVYIHDLTNLLLDNNYTLTRSILNSIIRPMTLTILRQLDSTRKILLIKFLYESKMIRTDYENIHIDLTDANLNGIKFGQIHLKNLSLPRTSMINASFISTNLEMSNFEGADLTNALFINADLSEVNFYRTRLIHAQFNDSILTYADFQLADLTKSIIMKDQLYMTSYNMAKLSNGTEALNKSLIDLIDKCSLIQWTIYPKKSINLTKQCYFIALENNLTMKYEIPILSLRRLFEKQQALIQFRFQAKIKNETNFRIDFIYQNENLLEELHRESGIIISKTVGTINKSFFQYEISAGYPRQIYRLFLEIFLNNGDIYTDFEFYIQHIDFNQYR